MEVINLELEKDKHNTINLDNSNISSKPYLNEIKIDKPKDSNIGIDLLVNKSKTSSQDTPVEEFKPKISMESNNLNINDIGSSISQPNIIKLDNNVSNNSTSINLNTSESLENDLDLNLDNLFDDKSDDIFSNSKSEESKSADISKNNESEPVVFEKPKSFEELQKEKAEYLRLLEGQDAKGIHSHKKFNMNSGDSEIKTEFERLSRQRECDQSIKFQRKMLDSICNS